VVLLISFYLIVSNHQKPFLNCNLAFTDSLTHAVILFFILLNILMISIDSESSKNKLKIKKNSLGFFLSSICLCFSINSYFCCCCEISYLLSAKVSCYVSQWALPPHDGTHNFNSEADESWFHLVRVSSATLKEVWKMCSFSVEASHSIGGLEKKCLKALEISS